MTRTRPEPVEAQPERRSMAQRLWPIGIVADVAAVVTLVSGSKTILAAVIAAVALLLGVVHLAANVGKLVDRWVIVSVAGIVAGAVVITVIVTQSVHGVVAPPNGQAASPPTSSPAPHSPAPTPPSSAPISTDPAAPPVKRQTGDDPIVLTSAYSLDLDSDDPLWVAKKDEGTSGSDLRNSSGTLYAPDDLAPVPADATYEDCVRAGYVDYLSSSDIEPGTAFCVKTSGGAYARVIIRDSQDEATRLTLDVVVWEEPA
ncbi:hypothetical protein ABT324_23130 [Saccharopolyspora sp. NPDC000359]|uniref:hypothetical protein n=1 Tax=Saccharopolyspora sp. NPDC000359 TaxID=3154251 RepID=UPI00331D1509